MSVYYIINFVNALFRIYYVLLIIRIILSWVPHDPYNSIIQFLYMITEPFLRPFRELLQAVFKALNVDYRSMMLDFSPILAILVLFAVNNLVNRLIIMLLS